MANKQNFNNIKNEVNETINEIDNKLKRYFGSFSKKYEMYIAWLIQANGPIVVCNGYIKNLNYMIFNKDMFGDVYIIFSNKINLDYKDYTELGRINKHGITYDNFQVAKSMLEHMHIILDENKIEELIDDEYNKFLKTKEEIQKIY